MSTELQDLYSSNMKGQHQPTADSMTTTLQYMMDKFDHFYIIIDALDECEDRDELLQFIKTMKTWESSKHHVLVTSRKEKDIEDAIGSIVTGQICMESGSVDPDIRIYVEEKLKHDIRLDRWSEEVQREIMEVLMQGTAGM